MIKISTFLQNLTYFDDVMNIFVCDAMFETLWWPQGWIYFFFEKKLCSWKVLISSKNVLDFIQNGKNKICHDNFFLLLFLYFFLSFLIWKHFAQLLVIHRLPVFLSDIFSYFLDEICYLEYSCPPTDILSEHIIYVNKKDHIRNDKKVSYVAQIQESTH